MNSIAIFTNESELIAAFKTGSQQAFKTLYQTYWQYVHSVAYRFTRSASVADDLVQEVFIALWSNRTNVDEQRPFKPYLRSVVRFKIVDHLRQLSRSRQEDFLRQVRSECYGNGESNVTEEIIACSDLDQWLEQELKGLPDKSQYIFRLSRVEQFTNAEIAVHLNISVKNVEYHIAKALYRLRSRLHEHSGILYSVSCLLLLF